MSAHVALANRGKGLCLLSLDAGGSRSISQLKILTGIMHRLNFEAGDSRVDEPCGVFDMIGGVGSGGFIAILLVIFRMTVEDAMEEFIHLSVDILDKADVDTEARTMALRDHVDRLLEKHGISKSARLLDANERPKGCKLIAPISYKRHAGSICILRNYPVLQEQPLNLTIGEALVATLATPPLFASAPIFKDAATFEFIGADLTLRNPTQEIIAEAHDAFGADNRVACLLSIGSGGHGIVCVPEHPNPTEWNQFLEHLLVDGQRRAQDLESLLGQSEPYHRFNVTSGLEGLAVMQPGEILTHTSAYLSDIAVSRKLDPCVNSLRRRGELISLNRLKYPGSQSVLSSQFPPLTKSFVMRKEPFEFVKKALINPRDTENADDGPRMLVVTGIAGCGKTQLLLKFVKCCGSEFAYRFFIDGSSEDRIRTDITRNVRSLGYEHSQKSFEDSLLFLSQPCLEGMLLLLYDNVDDPALDLSPLLPQGDSCAICITSRNHLLGELHQDTHLQLDSMSMDEATELLLQCPSHSNLSTEEDRGTVAEIAQALDCLPIALQQARSYMLRSKCVDWGV